MPVHRIKIYNTYRYKDSTGRTVCLLSAAENGYGAVVESETYGYAYCLSYEFKALIKKSIKENDITIIINHAGEENWDAPLPEWREIYQSWIDMGVNYVVCHRPHIIQGWEKYNNGMIFYSLGNFAFCFEKKDVYPKFFSIIINTDSNEVEYVHTFCNRGFVEITNDKQLMKDMMSCNELLANKEMYKKYIEEKSDESYDEYKKLYKKVCCDYEGSIKEFLKKVIKKYVLRVKFQDDWLFHNIAIDSHLFVCKRVVRQRLKREKIL